MVAAARVPGFLPRTNGFRFSNSWPAGTPDVVITIPVVGRIAIGDAHNGLCGGMVFAVKDLHEFSKPPVPDADAPAQGTQLFNYLVARLIDSFSLITPLGPAGSAVTKYFDWMNSLDHDTGFDTPLGHVVTRRGLPWRTIHDEWPRIRSEIDSGHTSPLGLVTVQTADPTMLGHNHQVLCYGYDLDEANNLALHIYDPNSPLNDEVTIVLNIGNPEHTTPITHNVDIADPIRGFFRVDYSPRDPSALIPPPPAMTVTLTRPARPFPPTEVTFAVHAQDAGGVAITAAIAVDGTFLGTSDANVTASFAPHVTSRVIRQRRPGTGSGRPNPGDIETIRITTTTYPKVVVSAPGFLVADLDVGLQDHTERQGADD